MELSLREASTKDLVEELMLREGVRHRFVNPNQKYELHLPTQDLFCDGPARILIVED